MPFKQITEVLYKEIRDGVHVLELLDGHPESGHQPTDFLIVSTYKGSRHTIHTYRPDTLERHDSFARLREALLHVPEGYERNHEDAYLHVLHSDEETVASLIVSLNPDGSRIVLLGYHGDIPRLQAQAIIHEAGCDLIEGYSHIN